MSTTGHFKKSRKTTIQFQKLFDLHLIVPQT